MNYGISKLNAPQVAILTLLASLKPDSDGLTRDEIDSKLGYAAANATNLGPAFGETLEGNDTYKDSLLALGLVSSSTEAETGLRWTATGRGLKIVDGDKAVKTLRKVTDDEKVPFAKLDRAVIAFRPTRTYGIERYTDEDLKVIRKALPSEFAELDLDILRQQIANRRKRGAYADASSKFIRAIKATLQYFGPEAESYPILTSNQQEQFNKLLKKFSKK